MINIVYYHPGTLDFNGQIIILENYRQHLLFTIIFHTSTSPTYSLSGEFCPNETTNKENILKMMIRSCINVADHMIFCYEANDDLKLRIPQILREILDEYKQKFMSFFAKSGSKARDPLADETTRYQTLLERSIHNIDSSVGINELDEMLVS